MLSAQLIVFVFFLLQDLLADVQHFSVHGLVILISGDSLGEVLRCSFLLERLYFGPDVIRHVC